ncbi:MAG: insulinase family protein, partial [Campylobacteraceae bacterium]|nr:insulinase family protein [Campylobacteraceae bacterium]
MKNLIKIILLLSILNFYLQAKNLEKEKTLIEGQLENGFKYTIKKNSKPQNNAEFRLIIKAGSLEEEEDQRGVAHFLEHMAFNGTKNFKGNEVITFLESIGVAFGSHANASTGPERTLYTLSIPIKDDNIDKSIMILSDWANRIELNQKELDKERGIILEEKRSRNSLGYRLYSQVKEEIYKNSKYKDREPIGTEEVIKNVSLKRVKDFYEDWYRPELMHIVAVGDFDVKKIEELIIKNFKGFKNNNHKKLALRTVPLINKTRILFLKDKEVSSSSLALSYFTEYENSFNEKDYKKRVINNIMIILFNRKAKEQILKDNPAALEIYLNTNK